MGDPECNKEQEDVFEDALEAYVPSAQGLEDSSAETQQVGYLIAFGSYETLVTDCGASEHLTRTNGTFRLLYVMLSCRSGLRSATLVFAWLPSMPRWQHMRLRQRCRSKS